MAETTEGKPSLDWAIICDDVRPEMGDKISLMGLFDTVWTQAFPATTPRLAVVANWGGGPGDFKSEILLASPTGEILQGLGTTTIKLAGHGKTHRHIAIVLNVQFKSPGIYQVKVLLDNSVYRSIPLPVQTLGKSRAN